MIQTNLKIKHVHNCVYLYLTFILFINLIGRTSIGYAQTYVPLSPSSDLNCIHLPNGKTLISRANAKGYKKLSFESAVKSTKKNLKKSNAKLRNADLLIKSLRKQQSKGKLFSDLNSKEFKAVKKVLSDGTSEGLISESIPDIILGLESTKNSYKASIEFEKQLVGLIQRCKKNLAPESGTMGLTYYPIDRFNPGSGSGLLLVLASVPSFYYPYASNLCFQRPGGSVLQAAVIFDPCTEGSSTGGPLTNTPGACNGIPRENSTLFAVVATQNFNYVKSGTPTFEEAAANAEGNLRSNVASGNWGDTIPYNTFIGPACRPSAFQ